MTTKETKHPCAEGHNFQEILGSDFRRTVAGETWIYRTLFCTKCGETKEAHIAIWGKYKGEKKETLGDAIANNDSF